SHSFAAPLATAHGRIAAAESFIIRVDTSDGRLGFGEVVRLPGFGGSEVQVLKTFCQALAGKGPRGRLESRDLPPELQFACGAALAMIDGRLPRSGKWPLARLLPAGPHALYEAGRRIRQGSRCFKYKLIGIPDATEMEIIGMLFEILRSVGGRIRFDANGSLPEPGAADFLLALSREGRRALDYVEQPYPAGREDEMRLLMRETGVPVALDESILGPENLARWMDWQGPLVVKPSLLGNPVSLARLLDGRMFRTVLSSAFEGPVGLWGCMLAIGERRPEPLGFGVGVWGEGDAWGAFTSGASIESGAVTAPDMEEVWHSLLF
ncbi:MAG TPA: o-succinylbenzoate synthase, partial [Opitutales bacterium]|nr:o-succinylbenzoate synthase [Opitutales bacterium]